jgi:transcriptional regulator with XRE-family HTH domain
MPTLQVNLIGEIVKSTRKQNGWSQEEFAGICDIGLRTIQRIESGEKANVETLRAIATFLKCDVSELLPLNEPVSTEAVARMQGQLQKQFLEVEKEINILPEIQNGKELLSIVASFEALNTDYPSPANSEEGDAIANLLSMVRDYVDIHAELDPRSEIEMGLEVGLQIQELNRLGLKIFAGKLRGSVVFPAPIEGGIATRLRYGGVFICRARDVKLFNDPNSGGRMSARIRVPFGPVTLG